MASAELHDELKHEQRRREIKRMEKEAQDRINQQKSQSSGNYFQKNEGNAETGDYDITEGESEVLSTSESREINQSFISESDHSSQQIVESGNLNPGFTQSGNLYDGDYDYKEAISASFVSSTTETNTADPETLDAADVVLHRHTQSEGNSRITRRDEGNKKEGDFTIREFTESFSTSTVVTTNQTSQSTVNSSVNSFDNLRKSGDTIRITSQRHCNSVG